MALLLQVSCLIRRATPSLAQLLDQSTSSGWFYLNYPRKTVLITHIPTLASSFCASGHATSSGACLIPDFSVINLLLYNQVGVQVGFLQHPHFTDAV